MSFCKPAVRKSGSSTVASRGIVNFLARRRQHFFFRQLILHVFQFYIEFIPSTLHLSPRHLCHISLIFLLLLLLFLLLRLSHPLASSLTRSPLCSLKVSLPFSFLTRQIKLTAFRLFLLLLLFLPCSSPLPHLAPSTSPFLVSPMIGEQPLSDESAPAAPPLLLIPPQLYPTVGSTCCYSKCWRMLTVVGSTVNEHRPKSKAPRPAEPTLTTGNSAMKSFSEFLGRSLLLDGN